MKVKLFLATAAMVIFLLWQIPQFFSKKNLLIFCDVGEADGAVLITPENVFLIDAGRDRRMVQCLERHLPFFRREITGVILTHPDADHINGLNYVIKSYGLKYLFSNFSPNKTGEYRKIYDVLINSGVIFKSFEKGEKIVLGNEGSRGVKGSWGQVKIESLWPLNEHHEYESTNLFSTVSTITIGESKFLMLADAEIAIQLQIMSQLHCNFERREESPKELTADNCFTAVKLSHHGSSKNFSFTLMKAVNPAYAIISVGQNSYGHPGKKVLELIEKLGIKILRTDEVSRLRPSGYGEPRDIVFECEKKCQKMLQ